MRGLAFATVCLCSCLAPVPADEGMGGIEHRRQP